MDPGYPAPRTRGEVTPRAPLAGFIAHESTRGYVAVADVEGDIIRFSGTVQRVDLRCETFGVVVRLTDRDNREVDTITLRALESRTIDVACSVVRASNAVALSLGALQVVGYFQCAGHSGIQDVAALTPSGATP